MNLLLLRRRRFTVHLCDFSALLLELDDDRGHVITPRPVPGRVRRQAVVEQLFADGGDLGGRLLDALGDKVDDLLAGHGVPDAVAGQDHEGVRRRVYPQRAHVRRGGDHLLRQGERLVLLVRVVA